MSDLADLFTDVAGVIDEVMEPLQETFTQLTWVGRGGSGPLPLVAVPGRRGAVEHRSQQHRLKDGTMVPIRHHVVFSEIPENNGAVGRDEPVDPKDQLQFSDGSIGEIIDMTKMKNPTTGIPYYIEVWLG
jgi:hypothetical protein